MKRRDLERRLRIAGCFLKREGGNHSIWMNPKNGVTEAVPRHSEIKEPLARKILKKLDAEWGLVGSAAEPPPEDPPASR